MRNFYFESVTARGTGKQESTITFTPGLNIIQGRSNTGKTAIIKCIDFALGGKDLPLDESFGYDEISVRIQTPKGMITIDRRFHENKVQVITNIKDWQTGSYDIKRNDRKKIPSPILSDLLLTSIGIGAPCEIIKNGDFAKQKLSFRTFLHMLMFISPAIGETQSVIEPKEFSQKTSFLSALLYLITGENLSDHEIQTKREIRVARRKAVEEYVNQQIIRTVQKRGLLQKQLKTFEGVDVQQKIETLLDDISNTEQEMRDATQKRKDLLIQIGILQERAAESEVLRGRYHALKTQYVSDIHRLSFIADGEMTHAGMPHNTLCPFCDSKMPERHKNSYIKSAQAEHSRILAQLHGLEETERDVTAELAQIAAALTELEKEKSAIDNLIAEELRPKIESLKNTLIRYREYIQLNNEMHVISAYADTWESDLRNLPDTSEASVKYRPKEHFGAEFQKQIDIYYKEILEECGYNATTTRFNLPDFDIEIDGHKKSGYQGQGYCSFINSVTALVFRRYLAYHAKYDPGFLIIDTPLLGLDQGVEDAAPESMRAGLFKYFINHQNEGQIIILENIMHIPALNYSGGGANVITFTKGLEMGRYGFLNGVS